MNPPLGPGGDNRPHNSYIKPKEPRMELGRTPDFDIVSPALGRIVETAPVGSLYADPKHPYTRALLSAVPRPEPQRMHRQQRIMLEGDAPSPVDPPPGCPFHPRCWHPLKDEACTPDGSHP